MRARLVEQLAGVDQEAANLADAIALGGNLQVLLDRLQIAQSRRQELARALAALEDRPRVPRVDWRATERQARALLRDWRALLGRQTEQARELLKELLEGPLAFTPILEATRRGYRFEGAIRIGGLLAGNVEVTSVGVPGQN